MKFFLYISWLNPLLEYIFHIKLIYFLCKNISHLVLMVIKSRLPFTVS
jgi:hypothetical protein